MRRKTGELGQATYLTVFATAIVLLGCVGLAVDGSHLYAERQMAQAAADAAAEAAMLSVYNGSNAIAGATHSFTATAGTYFNCSAHPNATPCNYATTYNGYAASEVDVFFGSSASLPTWAPTGLSLSNDPTSLVRVTVTRSVSTTFLRLLGAGLLGQTASTIRAQAIAAILTEISPIPLIVTHPHLAASLQLSGNPNITITGGPSRAIQVDSDGTVGNPGPPPTSAPNAYCTSAGSNCFQGSGSIDLSGAGPSGTGADFAILGDPTSKPSSVTVGTGSWVQPASPYPDPLASVSAPPDPSASSPAGPTNPPTGTLTAGSNGCPTGSGGCTLYFPGKYTNNIDVKAGSGGGGAVYAVFAPGIYFMYGSDFKTGANGNMYNATGLTDSNVTVTPTVANCCGTGTGWGGASNVPANAGILVYMTGPASGSTVTTGLIKVGANGNVTLVGSPNNSGYKGILFFVDRTAATQTEALGGGGNLILTGTIYANTSWSASIPTTTYQTVSLQGNPGSTTTLTGEIIAGTVTLGGNAAITMNLNSASVSIRQVALVR